MQRATCIAALFTCVLAAGTWVAYGADGVATAVLQMYSGSNTVIQAGAFQNGNGCQEDYTGEDEDEDSDVISVAGNLGSDCEVWVFDGKTRGDDGKIHCDGNVIYYRNTYGGSRVGDFFQDLPDPNPDADTVPGAPDQPDAKCVRVCCQMGNNGLGRVANNIPVGDAMEGVLFSNVVDQSPEVIDCRLALDGLAQNHAHDDCTTGSGGTWSPPNTNYAENSHVSTCEVGIEAATATYGARSIPCSTVVSLGYYALLSARSGPSPMMIYRPRGWLIGGKITFNDYVSVVLKRRY